ncbi:hypothetical protein ACFEME_004631, partial [Salmonella enterica]
MYTNINPIDLKAQKIILRPLLITRKAVSISSSRAFLLTIERITIMGLKPGPKRIADSTGEPDKRQRDN